MVIVQLAGGLGNQMFQYAAAKNISIRHKLPLLLDVNAYHTHDRHQGFELDRAFGLGTSKATASDIREVLGWRGGALFKRMCCSTARFFRPQKFICEPHFHYWPGLSKVNASCYLSGYWQSARYFEDIQHLVRHDFTFPEPLSGENRSLAEFVSRVNSVAVHYRRGDYISDPKTTAIHGGCPDSYYDNAIELVGRRVSDTRLVVFSDDIEFVRANWGGRPPAVFVDHNKGRDSYLDLRLMSLCKHNVIANSTFSWWAAWLNKNLSKIVVAPSRWFADPTVNTQDLFCTGWITL